MSDAPPVVPDRVGGQQWWPLITAAAGRYGLSAGGMFRLMMIESGGSATASNGGAFLGLYQYAPSTWAGVLEPVAAREHLRRRGPDQGDGAGPPSRLRSCLVDHLVRLGVLGY